MLCCRESAKRAIRSYQDIADNGQVTDPRDGDESNKASRSLASRSTLGRSRTSPHPNAEAKWPPGGRLAAPARLQALQPATCRRFPRGGVGLQPGRGTRKTWNNNRRRPFTRETQTEGRAKTPYRCRDPRAPPPPSPGAVRRSAEPGHCLAPACALLGASVGGPAALAGGAGRGWPRSATVKTWPWAYVSKHPKRGETIARSGILFHRN